MPGHIGIRGGTKKAFGTNEQLALPADEITDYQEFVRFLSCAMRTAIHAAELHEGQTEEQANAVVTYTLDANPNHARRFHDEREAFDRQD